MFNIDKQCKFLIIIKEEHPLMLLIEHGLMELENISDLILCIQMQDMLTLLKMKLMLPSLEFLKEKLKDHQWKEKLELSIILHQMEYQLNTKNHYILDLYIIILLLE